MKFIILKMTNLASQPVERVVNVEYIVSLGQHKNPEMCYVNMINHNFVVQESYEDLKKKLLMMGGQ